MSEIRGTFPEGLARRKPLARAALHRSPLTCVPSASTAWPRLSMAAGADCLEIQEYSLMLNQR
jgi:hypothetical protein